MGTFASNLSRQTEDIYRLLLTCDGLTAREIGSKLGIFPHAVYRSIKPILALGLVEQLDTYPVLYHAKAREEALSTFLLVARENFLRKFSQKKELQVSNNIPLDISFIQNRIDLLERSNIDIKQSTDSVHHIVSGLEIPAETVLELKNAVERGVQIKFLVQKLDEVNKNMLFNWQRLGIEVKYFPLLESRIIIIDEKIVYITSYNPDKKEEAVGVRFVYPPIAFLMEEVFLKRWDIAKKI